MGRFFFDGFRFIEFRRLYYNIAVAFRRRVVLTIFWGIIRDISPL